MKTKKNRAMTRASGIAVILAVLLTGLTACQNGMEIESLPLPHMLPVASISGGNSSSLLAGGYSFVLEWKRPDGPLQYNALYDTDAPENIDAINAALATWEEYLRITDPLPGYKKPGQEKITDGVFKDGKLDNSQAAIDAKGELVIPRFWPAAYLGAGTSLAKAAWVSVHADRVEDFKKAEAATKKMIAALEASALYAVVDPDSGISPLRSLADSMKEYIAYPDTALNDRTEFDLPVGGSGAGMLDTAKTGPLYEYFFGFIPDNDGNGYVESGGPFAYQ